MKLRIVCPPFTHPLESIVIPFAIGHAKADKMCGKVFPESFCVTNPRNIGVEFDALWVGGDGFITFRGCIV